MTVFTLLLVPLLLSLVLDLRGSSAENAEPLDNHARLPGRTPASLSATPTEA